MFTQHSYIEEMCSRFQGLAYNVAVVQLPKKKATQIMQLPLYLQRSAAKNSSYALTAAQHFIKTQPKSWRETC